MHLDAVVPPAEVQIQAPDVGRGLVAPAVVTETLARHVDGDVALLRPVLQPAADAPEGAAQRVGFESVVGEAVLELKAHGSTERVEAEHRVVRPDVGALDGVGRDEVPVDRVAECFVEADAVHVDRQPLRPALERGGGEATVLDLLHRAIAVRIGKGDAGNALEQHVGHVR